MDLFVKRRVCVCVCVCLFLSPEGVWVPDRLDEREKHGWGPNPQSLEGLSEWYSTRHVVRDLRVLAGREFQRRVAGRVQMHGMVAFQHPRRATVFGRLGRLLHSLGVFSSILSCLLQVDGPLNVIAFALHLTPSVLRRYPGILCPCERSVCSKRLRLGPVVELNCVTYHILCEIV